jgi:crotonobetainyl-CoA:carnitine CoA-transferase CaiB-like acyl-CoA transferase
MSERGAAADIEHRPGPLDGIRVLDVAQPLGAFVSRILGDLGADVIKIEPPAGASGRRAAPFRTVGAAPVSLPFMHANLSKRGMILDLEEGEGQARFATLVEQADVVVSTESSATWAARGLYLDRLPERYPRLVWMSISPFGLSGLYHDYVGNNIVVEAMGGLMTIQGDDTRPPCVSPCAQGQHLASLHAAFGTLLALRERQSSGRGQVVEVSMQEVIAHIHFTLVHYTYGSDITRRPGVRNPITPNGYYPCRDGHVFISLFMPHQWDRLVALIADPALADPALRDRDYRQQQIDLVESGIQKFTEGFDCWALTDLLQRHGIPAAPLSTVADLASNVHLAARHFFTDIEQPPLGIMRSVGPLFRASATPPRVLCPAPWQVEQQPVEWHATAFPMACTAVPPAADNPRALPLAGIRVLDLSRVWAGPYGTRYLADYGAEVIKVESGKFPERRPNNPDYAEINRNKRFITLNFQLPQGQELLRRLVAVSDVVVENFSPRVMTKYGFNYERLAEIRPDLIMASMPGFGHSGPHRDFGSYGGPLMAYTGMALLWGYADSPLDAHSKIAYPDYLAAGTLALAVLAALQHRDRTGEGQFIEIAQVEATAAAMEVAFLDYFANGRIAVPMGNRDPSAVPQGCYPCLGFDAWCVVSCESEAQWRALAQVIGGDALAASSRFATTAERWQRHDELDEMISAWTRERTPHQAMRLLQAAGVAAGAVQTGEDLWRDAHLRMRDFMLSITHPEPGRLEHPGLPVRLHTTPGQVRRPAGHLGEANEEIFQGLLGLAPEEIAHLVADGVIA